jgi:hypothetical protein
MQDFIGVRIADTGDHGLAAQHACDLGPACTRENPCKAFNSEGGIERIWPEPRDAGQFADLEVQVFSLSADVPHDLPRQGRGRWIECLHHLERLSLETVDGAPVEVCGKIGDRTMDLG